MDTQLNVLAQRANDAHRLGMKAFVEAGKALLEAKKLVPHGRWRAWIAEHCEFSHSSALVYMLAAKHPEGAEASLRRVLAAHHSKVGLVNASKSRSQVSRRKREKIAVRVCELLLINGRKVTQPVNKLLTQLETS